MARRSRSIPVKQKVEEIEADTVVIADKAIVNQASSKSKRTKRRGRYRRGGRVYESTPGWGRNDVPVGKGTKGEYRKAVVQPIAKTAVTEVE